MLKYRKMGAIISNLDNTIVTTAMNGHLPYVFYKMISLIMKFTFEFTGTYAARRVYQHNTYNTVKVIVYLLIYNILFSHHCLKHIRT